MAGDNLYIMTNEALPSVALPSPTAITTSANTILQLSTPSTRQFTIVEYGISFDGSPAAIDVQLRECNTAVATTNMVAGVIHPFTNPNAPTSLSTSGTSNSCYNNGTATTPTGTVAAIYDHQIISTNQYIKQWPLNREPGVPVSAFLQLVVKAAASVNCYAYIIWRE